MASSSQQMGAMADLSAELDDLGELFEFGDIDLNNIANVDAMQYEDPATSQAHSRHGTHPNTPFDEAGDGNPFGPPTTQSFGSHEQFGMSQNQAPPQQQQQRFLPQHEGQSSHSTYSADAIYQTSMQQAYPSHHSQVSPFHFQQPLGFPPGHQIPPTPNSYEMHGETGRFMQQSGQYDSQQQALLEQRYQLRKDDAIAYTPMVSPAGTPQYNMQPEFTVPGAYSFSPLTSPMLHAQNAQQHTHMQQQQHHQHQQGYMTNPSTAPSSAHASPIDCNGDVDMLGDVCDKMPSQARKTRRKIATPRSLGSSTNVRQSPAPKPQKRKSGIPPTMQIEHVERAPHTGISSAPASAVSQILPSFDSSETESISPEPLSESLMGPPPRPSTGSSRSPALLAQQQNLNLGAAATPKSLLSGGSNANGQQQMTPVATQHASQPGGLDDLSLPEAARKQPPRRPSLVQIDTQVSVTTDADEQTPRLASRKTPKLGPSSTPSSARPHSATASPSIVGSPMAATTPSALLRDKRDAGKGLRNNKKRASLSANGSKLVSPALVPRISPSIKPLLPEGTPLTSATQAMLLASKSNYQNLLEGNHLPGVTYPDSLSTGLTSKRTSHKVAEQGRRNRINEALKEMQALIPRAASSGTPKSAGGKKDASDDGDEDLGPAAPGAGATGTEDDNASAAIDESKDDANAKSHNSKAATVELANDYIRRMQREHAQQTAHLALLRRENEELRRKLALRSSDAGSDSSAAVDIAGQDERLIAEKVEGSDG